MIRTETSMTKRKGVKVTVFAKAVEGGEEVKEVKPAERLTELVSAPEGYVAGAVVEVEEEVKQQAARDDTIATTASGASLTVPIRAGEVKKGGFVLLKEKPCKVISVTTSKTGKHGHAKAAITGIDVFTGKKYVDVCPTSHNMTAPQLSRSEWQVTDLDRSSNALTLMNDGGVIREDLNCPIGADGELNDVANELITKFAGMEAAGKVMNVVVLSAMGHEQIVQLIEKDIR